MKKWALVAWVATAILASLAIAGCGGSTSQTNQPLKEESAVDLLARGRNLPGLSYDYVVTAKDKQVVGKMWIAGKKTRNEAMSQNRKFITIIDGDANIAYSYIPDQGMAIKIPLDKAMASAENTDNYTRDPDAAKIKVLDTVMLDNVKCKLLEVQSKSDSKMWVREDYGVLVRMEITDASGNKTVVENKNIVVGPIAPDLFQLPAGVKITDVSGMQQSTKP